MDKYTDGRNVHAVMVGTEVYGSDGDKVGIVGEVGGDYLIVEAGLLHTQKFRVPTANIARVDGQHVVHLSLPKGQIIATDS